MDRLTKEQIEELRALWLSQDTPSVSRDDWEALCDLALQSLSQESVRSEALEKLLRRWLSGEYDRNCALWEETENALQSPARVAEGVERARCILCSSEPSPGFYTGCMIEDGAAKQTGWNCDGKGNLTRFPSSPESPAKEQPGDELRRAIESAPKTIYSKEQPGEQNASPQELSGVESFSGLHSRPAGLAPDAAAMVKRLRQIAYALRIFPAPHHELEGDAATLFGMSQHVDAAAAMIEKLGQGSKSYTFYVDGKAFLAPAKRMSIAELKAIYGRDGTEFWFIKDQSDKATGRYTFHDSEIVDLGATTEFYVDLPARM